MKPSGQNEIVEVVEVVENEIGAERVGIWLSPFAQFLESSDSDPEALHSSSPPFHLLHCQNKGSTAPWVPNGRPLLVARFSESRHQ